MGGARLFQLCELACAIVFMSMTIGVMEAATVGSSNVAADGGT